MPITQDRQVRDKVVQEIHEFRTTITPEKAQTIKGHVERQT